MPLPDGRWARLNRAPPALPSPPSGPLVGAPVGHSQLLVGGQAVAGQEELGADGAAGLKALGPSLAGGVAAGGAALVQGEKLVKHVRDEHQSLIQLRHLWRQEERESSSQLCGRPPGPGWGRAGAEEVPSEQARVSLHTGAVHGPVGAGNVHACPPPPPPCVSALAETSPLPRWSR